ncbi:hypothetical protein SISSUDRAFT_1058402 [Sistotremastrum suecicum HHB10207 ss-3]|uniref:Cation/H+ exchanger transmembrane domain-containing protein n=1 Tax=Sistotremastrum suecicum HHB10207 ss-3 TaxID=1314776 RepID=A0A166HEI4_9AGAM|nr:hypothetical protein SISSUDRAFT_1058402 [Sistotremastrum suecicum HHB10207 ss-3]
MAFEPFDVTAPHVVYACLGGFVVLFGMFSLFIREKLYIGESIWAFVFGVAMGPYGANVFNPRGWGGADNFTVNNQITLEVTRVVLAIGVFAIGVELPKAYMKHHWRSLFFLLGPIMTWGWFVSAGLIYALIPGLNFLSSLAVAACLTPTDPILAAAVVGGKYADKHVPAHLRHLLAAESGCNDGAAFPFLYIALYLILDSTDKSAVRDWFLITWLYEIVLGVTIGTVLGIGFRHLMKFCERKDLIDRQSIVAQYVSLAIFTIGATTLLGSDDLLAAFASGTAFAWDGFFNKQTEQAVFSSVIDLLFNVAAFVFIGAWTPFNQFSSAELTLAPWRLIVIALLVLLLRRLPIMIALYKWIPDVKTFREAIFSGHFGPIGVGAVFISTLATTKLPVPNSPPQTQTELLAASIQPIVAFMVLCSIVTHGLSIPFFSLGRRVHSVSLTWSRHQSMDHAPEWTTHTRRVIRPEDIVINRDSEMERGEAGKIILDKESPSPTEKSPRAEHAREISDDETLAQEAKHHPTATPTDESPAESPDQARPDNPPDQDPDMPTTQEWREGQHLVIERNMPGEESEVEVIHNAFKNDDSPKVSSVIRGAEKGVEQEAGRYIDRLKNVPKQVEQEMEKALGHEAVAESSGKQSTTDDEGNASEDDGHRKSRSKKKRETSQRRHRRSGSRRDFISAIVHSGRGGHSSSHHDEDEQEEPSAPAEPPSIYHRHTPRSPRNRVLSIREENNRSGREASPARSIRWGDLEAEREEHNVPSPRSPISPVITRPGTPTQDEARAQPKVQFDLPSPPGRSR